MRGGGGYGEDHRLLECGVLLSSCEEDRDDIRGVLAIVCKAVDVQDGVGHLLEGQNHRFFECGGLAQFLKCESKKRG